MDHLISSLHLRCHLSCTRPQAHSHSKVHDLQLKVSYFFHRGNPEYCPHQYTCIFLKMAAHRQHLFDPSFAHRGNFCKQHISMRIPMEHWQWGSRPVSLDNSPATSTFESSSFFESYSWNYLDQIQPNH